MTREIKRFIYVIAALLLIASIFIYLPADMRHWGFLIFGLALVIPFVIWQTAWEKFLEKLPRPFNLPSTEARFRIWQKTYSIIKPLRVQKSKWGYVIAILETQHPDLPHDQNTLKDILDAGDAGCLQSWPIDIEACREKSGLKTGNPDPESGIPTYAPTKIVHCEKCTIFVFIFDLRGKFDVADLLDLLSGHPWEKAPGNHRRFWPVLPVHAGFLAQFGKLPRCHDLQSGSYRKSGNDTPQERTTRMTSTPSTTPTIPSQLDDT